jgi:hypothetical protein
LGRYNGDNNHVIVAQIHINFQLDWKVSNRSVLNCSIDFCFVSKCSGLGCRFSSAGEKLIEQCGLFCTFVVILGNYFQKFSPHQQASTLISRNLLYHLRGYHGLINPIFQKIHRYPSITSTTRTIACQSSLLFIEEYNYVIYDSASAAKKKSPFSLILRHFKLPEDSRNYVPQRSSSGRYTFSTTDAWLFGKSGRQNKRTQSSVSLRLGVRCMITIVDGLVATNYRCRSKWMLFLELDRSHLL